MDAKMDTTADNAEGMKTELENKKIMHNDFSAKLSDETHQHLAINEGPSSSCRKVLVRSRPRLQLAKSFPPYNQCIGGLGDNTEPDNELISETDIADPVAHQPPVRLNEVKHEDKNQIIQGTERKGDAEETTKCARDEVRAKWRARRRERMGGSCEANTDTCGIRWSGKRRVEETGGENKHDGEGSEWKQWRSKNSSFETDRNEEGVEEEKRSILAGERENEGSGGTFEGKDEENEELRGASSTKQWSSPHPILSKLLHSSSSTSSCSSINLSSAESDDVFSEAEDADRKRKTFRKCRTWKTYLTMMHWSLRRQSSWVQLAGHQGNFQLSEGGEVLKLYSVVEANCLDYLMRDPLRPFVPEYHGKVTRGEHCYICLEDLLSGLRKPVIMDCKMGIRTYQEEELVKARTKATLRSDMYQKMLKIEPMALSAEEHAQRGVTKLRYLQWRDANSSTSTLGFRIEGIMTEDGSVQRDFRNIRTLAQATEALLFFTKSQVHILKAYYSRLLALNDALTNSPFFRNHEVIGSSLLFVHDNTSKASVWMIDFGKTTPVPDTSKLQHNVPWAEGNREDGYLIGLTSLINSLSQAISVVAWQQEDSIGGVKSFTLTD
ncbi:inositol-trisphosphate 3-kinase B-like [Echeneis naucrates]|uniref:inositol-trisphosphate 3-kinase B-like n=1 Tax=Echeneis naucrates TaxID=173247 RepID=UPI001113885B|nr:inositol-trisphosphate 3-kinase B-like [Echeneis naucrates]